MKTHLGSSRIANGSSVTAAQLYPLKPGEPREVRLEFRQGGEWREVAKAAVVYPG